LVSWRDPHIPKKFAIGCCPEIDLLTSTCFDLFLTNAMTTLNIVILYSVISEFSCEVDVVVSEVDGDEHGVGIDI
jgi:hypothetical protein